MFRIDHPTAAATLPAPAAAGTPGYFQGGNPAAGTPRTVVTQDWANMVQEELAAVASFGGAVLSKTNNSQVRAGVQALIAGAFGGSLAPSGYVRLPNGLIIQWVQGATVTGNGDLVYFPTTFPTAVFGVVANEAFASGWSSNGSAPQPRVFGATAVSTSAFKLYCAAVTSTGASVWVSGDAFFCIAVGN